MRGIVQLVWTRRFTAGRAVPDEDHRYRRSFGIFGAVAMLFSRSCLVTDFAMAFLTFFRTISVKIALRIERGPEPPGRHRLSLSPHAHYVHPDFPISLRFSRST